MKSLPVYIIAERKAYYEGRIARLENKECSTNPYMTTPASMETIRMWGTGWVDENECIFILNISKR